MSHRRLPMSCANLGLLGCACGLAGVIVPPLLLVALPAAHCSWWRWTSGREEGGFSWAISAMLVGHAVFGFWLVVAGVIFAGADGAALAFVYLIFFFLAVGIVLQSKAAKYFTVGAALAGATLALISCGAYQQSQAAHRIQCAWNLRSMWANTNTLDDGYDRHPQSLGAQREQASMHAEAEYNPWTAYVLPLLEVADSPHAPERDPFSEDELSAAP